MKTLLKTVLVILGVIPYLFLATHVKRAEKSGKNYNCVAGKIYESSGVVNLGSAYFNTNFFLNPEKRIILPYFFYKQQAIVLQCGSKNFSVGVTDNIEDRPKEGEKMNLYTDLYKIGIFSVDLYEEEGMNMYSNSWREECGLGECFDRNYDDEDPE